LFVGATVAPGRKIVQAGLFDRGILCADHEAALGPYDDYGIEFCRNFRARHRDHDPNGWSVANVDGDQLARFWLAVLWRFSLSTRPETAMVQLGPFEDRVRDILFAGTPCSVDPAIIMFRYQARVIPPDNVCFPPYKSFFPGTDRIRAYGLAVGGFHALVKVDGRRLPRDFYAATINGKSEVLGGYLELEKSHQFRVMLQIVKNMSLRPGSPRKS
jgi:hypothetical protein